MLEHILVTITIIGFLIALLTVGLNILPLTVQAKKYIAIGQISMVFLIAIIAWKTPVAQTNISYCMTLAHHHWPLSSLLIYSVLFINSCFLLQGQNRLAGVFYLLLIILPLTLAPWIVKQICIGIPTSALSDITQGIVLAVSFPPVTIIIGLLFFVYFGLAIKSDNRLLWPNLALISEFFLLIQHARHDWFRFFFGE